MAGKQPRQLRAERASGLIHSPRSHARLKAPRIGPEFFVPRQSIVVVHPGDSAAPEDMKAWIHGFGLVEGCDAEIDRFWLVIHFHEERSPTAAAERAATEGRGFDRRYNVRSSRPHKVALGNGREDHRGRTTIELARTAVAPTAIEWFAPELVAYRSAHTSAGQSHRGSPLIDYEGVAPYIARRNFPSVGGSASPFPDRAGF